MATTMVRTAVAEPLLHALPWPATPWQGITVGATRMPNRPLAQHDELVLRMRSEGATFRAIADAIGHAKVSSAWRYYRRALARQQGLHGMVPAPVLVTPYHARASFIAPTAVDVDPGHEGPNFAAWAAGFFDGEGSVVASITQGARGQKDALSIQISQTTPAPLVAIQRRWGGHVRDIGIPKARPHAMVCQRQWRWQSFGRGAEPFLRDIQPFLRVKHDHVLLALQFVDLIWGRGYDVPDEVRERRRRLVEAIRRLNSRRHTSREEGVA